MSLMLGRGNLVLSHSFLGLDPTDNDHHASARSNSQLQTTLVCALRDAGKSGLQVHVEHKVWMH